MSGGIMSGGGGLCPTFIAGNRMHGLRPYIIEEYTGSIECVCILYNFLFRLLVCIAGNSSNTAYNRTQSEARLSSDTPPTRYTIKEYIGV